MVSSALCAVQYWTIPSKTSVFVRCYVVPDSESTPSRAMIYTTNFHSKTSCPSDNFWSSQLVFEPLNFGIPCGPFLGRVEIDFTLSTFCRRIDIFLFIPVLGPKDFPFTECHGLPLSAENVNSLIWVISRGSIRLGLGRPLIGPVYTVIFLSVHNTDGFVH